MTKHIGNWWINIVPLSKEQRIEVGKFFDANTKPSSSFYQENANPCGTNHIWVTKNLPDKNVFYSLSAVEKVDHSFGYELTYTEFAKRFLPELLPRKEQLLEQARANYPVGTRYKSLVEPEQYTIDKNKPYWNEGGDIIWPDSGLGALYRDGKWAEIVGKPITRTESLLEEAKRRYPIGTKYKNAVNKQESVIRYELVYGANDNIYGQSKTHGSEFDGAVYYKGEWAEILETKITKPVVADYVEAIKDYNGYIIKGYIYKLENPNEPGSWELICNKKSGNVEAGKPLYADSTVFKPSTKMAYDKQLTPVQKQAVICNDQGQFNKAVAFVIKGETYSQSTYPRIVDLQDGCHADEHWFKQRDYKIMTFDEFVKTHQIIFKPEPSLNQGFKVGDWVMPDPSKYKNSFYRDVEVYAPKELVKAVQIKEFTSNGLEEKETWKDKFIHLYGWHFPIDCLRLATSYEIAEATITISKPTPPKIEAPKTDIVIGSWVKVGNTAYYTSKIVGDQVWYDMAVHSNGEFDHKDNWFHISNFSKNLSRDEVRAKAKAPLYVKCTKVGTGESNFFTKNKIYKLEGGKIRNDKGSLYPQEYFEMMIRMFVYGNRLETATQRQYDSCPHQLLAKPSPVFDTKKIEKQVEKQEERDLIEEAKNLYKIGTEIRSVIIPIGYTAILNSYNDLRVDKDGDVLLNNKITIYEKSSNRWGEPVIMHTPLEAFGYAYKRTGVTKVHKEVKPQQKSLIRQSKQKPIKLIKKV